MRALFICWYKILLNLICLDGIVLPQQQLLSSWLATFRSSSSQTFIMEHHVIKWSVKFVESTTITAIEMTMMYHRMTKMFTAVNTILEFRLPQKPDGSYLRFFRFRLPLPSLPRPLSIALKDWCNHLALWCTVPRIFNSYRALKLQINRSQKRLTASLFYKLIDG